MNINLQFLYARALRKLRGSAVRNSTIHSTSKVESGSTIASVILERHSFCGYDCSIIDAEIGSFCSIASSVVIGGYQHPMDFVSTSPVFLSHRDSVREKFSHHVFDGSRRTRIGNDVWIGERAIVKAGVSIGHGAVVGMGAVVTKDVEPYLIVAGNPARQIRKRFPDDVIEALLKLAWWDMSDQELRRIAPKFRNPEEMLRGEGLL